MQVLSPLNQFVSLTSLNTSNDNLTLSTLADVPSGSRPFLLTILIACSLAIIIILTILGNILVLIALCVDFALRSPTHLLMGNLACADLLLGNKNKIYFLFRQGLLSEALLGINRIDHLSGYFLLCRCCLNETIVCCRREMKLLLRNQSN